MVNISEEQIVQYERDGAICLRGLFEQEMIAELLKAVDQAIIDDEKVGNGSSVRDPEKYNPLFDEFNRRSPQASIAKILMRSSRVQFYFDQIFFKNPAQQSKPTPWHHDLPFWPIQGEQVCSIWLALDHITKESSGMQYVAGSHRWGKFFRPPFLKGSDQVGFDEDDVMPDIDANKHDYSILHWDMEPGDCLVHQGLSVHMAGSNQTQDRKRRALATRWFGDDARYRAGGGDVPLMVDGLETGALMPESRFPVMG